jgi:hypothetical protein
MSGRILTAIQKKFRNVTSPNRPLSDEVWLMIVEDTPTGAVLSSDYAEARVNEKAFRRLDKMRAAMLRSDAALCGLEDGWS